MWVTIYADASFHHPTRSGSWAVWIKSEAGRIVRSGSCPEYVRDSVAAELAAIFAGLHLATTEWSNIRGVWVRSDCTPALSLADPRSGHIARRVATRTLQSKIHTLLATRSISLEQRWVKGHRKPDVRDAWLNGAVDRLARTKNIASRPRAAAEPSPGVEPPRSNADAPVSKPARSTSGLSRKRRRRRRAGGGMSQGDSERGNGTRFP